MIQPAKESLQHFDNRWHVLGMVQAISQQLQESLTTNQEWLRGLARALVGEADADDLVQETMEQALLHPPATDRSIRPWLRITLKNCSRMRWRSRSRQHAREEIAESITHNEVPTPMKGLQKLQTQASLVSAVLRLNEPYQKTVILRYVDGLSSAAIARTLKIPAATVRSHLRRGLEILRTTLDEEYERSHWRAALLPFSLPPMTDTIVHQTKGTKLNIRNTLPIIVASIGSAALYSQSVSGTENQKTVRAAMEQNVVEVENRGAKPESAARSKVTARTNSHFVTPHDRDQLIKKIESARKVKTVLKVKTYDFLGADVWPELVDWSDSATKVFPEAEEPFGISHIQNRIKNDTTLFAECYQMAREETPTLQGRLVLEFIVEAEEDIGGYVRKVSISNDLLDNAILNECLTESVLSLAFSAPAKSDSIRIIYPLRFMPTKPSSELE